jgi:hypothetical protein
MSHTIQDVQESAFELLKDLREKKIDVQTAHAGVAILGTVIQSAKVAVDYMRTCRPDDPAKLPFFDVCPESDKTTTAAITHKTTREQSAHGVQTVTPVDGARIIRHTMR